ncbi:FKBP9 [Symbiodinium sp. KB8]|nr:FKBP9 [Symbiodinium sp. KB8]
MARLLKISLLFGLVHVGLATNIRGGHQEPTDKSDDTLPDSLLAGNAVVGMDQDMRTKMLVQVKAMDAIVDACEDVVCGELKCPSGFTATKYDGHCCAYCVNPDIKIEPKIVGATGKFGAEESDVCPYVWCFPTMCEKEEIMPTEENGQCCPVREYLDVRHACLDVTSSPVGVSWPGSHRSDGRGIQLSAPASADGEMDLCPRRFSSECLDSLAYTLCSVWMCRFMDLSWHAVASGETQGDSTAQCDFEVFQSRRRWFFNAAASAGVAENLPAYAQGIDLGFLDPKAPKDVAVAPGDAEVTSSGLKSKLLLRPTCALSKSIPLTNPNCERPQPWDKVLIDYTGWTPAGKMIDSSRNEKRLVRVNSVMPGWTEGLQMMAPGESRRFWIPPELAFGKNESATSKPIGPLVFDVELYSIERQPKPPAELTAAPQDAVSTPSGLAYKKLKPGTGSRSPGLDSNVTALYNGWSSNGDLVLSTSFGAQDTFFIKEVPVEGLKEALQLLVEGETRRFWIPGKLAFGERAEESRGLPPGVLVFDVRLLSINS